MEVLMDYTGYTEEILKQWKEDCIRQGKRLCVVNYWYRKIHGSYPDFKLKDFCAEIGSVRRATMSWHEKGASKFWSWDYGVNISNFTGIPIDYLCSLTTLARNYKKEDLRFPIFHWR